MDIQVIKSSLTLMHVSAYRMRLELKDKMRFKRDFTYRKRAELAKKIIKLERVIEDMERLKMMASNKAA